MRSVGLIGLMTLLSFLALSDAGAGPLRQTSTLCAQNPDGNNAFLCAVDQAANPNALCNDSSSTYPPAFWVRKGSGSGALTWFIWLQGGGQCTDVNSCALRVQNQADLLTAEGFTTSKGAGVLSSNPTENPMLYNVNLVFVHYCSSDFWSGAHTPTKPYTYNSGDITTWAFQGRENVLATIATLKEPSLASFKFANAKRVLLGGSSAGGVGITLVANDILPLLPAATAGHVGLVNDAGFTLDIGQFDLNSAPTYIYTAGVNDFETSIMNGIALWAGTGDANCEMQFPKGSGGHVDCYNTAKVLQQQQVALPAFVDESQLDAAQLTDELCPLTYGNHCSIYANPTPEATVYENEFAQNMTSTLAGMGTQASYSVYSPLAKVHTMLDNMLFTMPESFPGGMLEPRDALDAWLTSPQMRILNIAN